MLRVAVPLVGDAHPAGEADASIDDQQLAVSAVVELVECVPARWMVFFDLDSRVAHGIQKAAVDLAATDPVDQDMDVDSLASACSQRIGKPLADLA